MFWPRTLHQCTGAVLMIGQGLLVSAACCRYEPAEVLAAVQRLGNQDPLGLIPYYSRLLHGGAPLAQADMGCVAAALGAAVLVDWETIQERHERPGAESAAQKAARRDEEAVQLLLRLHILALDDRRSPCEPATCFC